MNRSFKRHALFLSISLFGCHAYSQSDTYKVEGSAAYGDISLDAINATTYLLTGSIYFNEVSTSKGPLVLAPFLDKASSFTIVNITTGVDGNSIDQKFTSGNIRLVTGEKFIVLGELSRNKVEYDTYFYEGSVTEEFLTLGGGLYLTDTSTLTASFSRVTAEGDFSEESGNGYAVSYQTFLETPGDIDWSIELDASFVDVGSQENSDLGGSVYAHLSSALTLGVTLESRKTEIEDDETISLSSTYFFNPSFSLFAEVGQVSGTNDTDGTQILVGGSIRF